MSAILDNQWLRSNVHIVNFTGNFHHESGTRKFRVETPQKHVKTCWNARQIQVITLQTPSQSALKTPAGVPPWKSRAIIRRWIMDESWSHGRRCSANTPKSANLNMTITHRANGKDESKHTCQKYELHRIIIEPARETFALRNTKCVHCSFNVVLTNVSRKKGFSEALC